MKPPARIRLRLLGRLTILYAEGAAPIRLSTRKAGALIAYLAMRPDQTASREELATLLWGGGSDQQARQSLRQALVVLRKELGWSHFVVADPAVVRLQPGLWSVDASEFEQLSKSADPQELARAAELFGGEFLAGLNIEEEGFDEWLNGQRQRIQLAAARLCETFGARPELVADGQQAVAAVERLVALDPLREDWHRLALTLYARYRGRNEALAQADVFAETLRRELGVAPEKATRALIEKIRASEAASEQGSVTPIMPTAVKALQPAPEPASVRSQDQAAVPTDAVSAPTEAAPSAWMLLRPRRRVAAFASVLLVAAAGLGVYQWREASQDAAVQLRSPPSASIEHGPPADPSASPRSPNRATKAASQTRSSGVATILVLPFTLLGEDNDRSRLWADIMADDLTNALGRVGGFRVISRQTAATYRGKRVDPAAIGAELGVRYLIDGRVEAKGESLRAGLELIDTNSGLRAWSGNYERVGADAQAIIDEIVRSVGRELQVEITRIESRGDSADLDVHALIYRGFAALSARERETEALARAGEYFTEARARDPNSTRAMTGLGAYHVAIAARLPRADREEHLIEAEKLLRGVIERRPDVGGPSMFLGMASYLRGRDEEAVQWFEREIERNPSQSAAYAHLGRTLTRIGKPEEGLKQILYAMRLSPHDPATPQWLGFAGGAELALDHPAKAIEYLERAASLHASPPSELIALAAARALNGDLRAARMRLEQAQQKSAEFSTAALSQRYLEGLTQPGEKRLSDGLRLALTPAADPWASPPPPSKPPGEAAAVPNKRIVPILVLPFTTSGETEGALQSLADTVTDDLTNLLSRVGTLRVISRQTALAYRGQGIDVAALGSELQVRYVLEGSMRQHGESLRVNIELIDPPTRLPVWTTRIERKDADRSGVLDEITGRLALELQFEVAGMEAERRSKDHDTDALVARGWVALNHITPQSYRQAESYFQEALERDPQSVPAQIGMGAYHVRVGQLLLDSTPRDHRDKAENLLQDAIRRAPQSSAAHFFLGLALKVPPTYEQAVEEFERSIELNPSFSAAYVHIGDILGGTGRPAEGLEHIKYGLRLSPRDPSLGVYLNMAGAVEIELDHLDAAIDYFQRAVSLLPAYPRPRAGLAVAHALAGRIDEAHRAVEDLKRLVPNTAAEVLLARFGRTENSHYRQGLRLALTPSVAATATAPTR